MSKREDWRAAEERKRVRFDDCAGNFIKLSLFQVMSTDLVVWQYLPAFGWSVKEYYGPPA